MARIKKIRVFFIIVSLIGISTLSYAQISAGARIGANMANMSGSSVSNSEMLIGYNIGGFANYSFVDMISSDFGKIFSMQADLSIQQKGTTADYIYTSETKKEVKVDATYVQIPILAKFTFGEERSLQYFGEIGFYGSALFGLKIDGEVWRDHDGNPNTDRRKFREEYTGFDAGAVVGAGLSIPFGGRKSPWRAYFNLRYSLGLMNVGEEKAPSDISMEQLEDVKNNAISALVGVAYKF
jgi:hypothetical protein